MKSKALRTVHRKEVGHDEANASNLAMVRSVVTPETTSSSKESNEFVSLKRKHVEATECADGH